MLKFEFPDSGEGVTEGKFLEWHVEEGEEVEEDQVLAEAETDKAVVDIPAPADGVIKELKAKPGDKVEVGEVILLMETEENQESNESPEDEGTVEEESEPESRDETETGESESEEVEPKSTGSQDVLALPKVRKLAEEKGVELEALGIEGRITEEDVLEAAEVSEPVTEEETAEPGQEAVEATPAVRRLAREKGVDISTVEGSGRGGKVTREDVLEAAEESEESTGKSETHSVPEELEGEEERVEMNSIRKATAERMEKSRFTAPHVTHVEKADVTELDEMRQKLKQRHEEHITYLPFIIKACVQALKKYPDLNAELDEESDEIVRKYFYDFNIAVDTERGLLVPVVEDVDTKNMVEIASDITEKASKAKEGELDMSEMQGGTFSITNLGVIGGEEFTPIINYPQVAILGIGKIQETPEVVEGDIVPRTTVKLSLSYDHRVVDGATAARFMNEVKEKLEKPEELMVEM
ncbi:MAG: 2-oxo acid dehydrogenase subunit E2 [Candidatus Nanohaloarchaea archaeon]